MISADATLWGRTTGLCGSLNGNPYDDFKTYTGEDSRGLADFVQSWVVPDGELLLSFRIKSGQHTIFQENVRSGCLQETTLVLRAQVWTQQLQISARNCLTVKDCILASPHLIPCHTMSPVVGHTVRQQLHNQ